MLLLVLFAAAALVLASVGVYGVISYGVSQRTAELGVRVAMGAEPEDVLKLILGQGALLAALGVGLGLLGKLQADLDEGHLADRFAEVTAESTGGQVLERGRSLLAALGEVDRKFGLGSRCAAPFDRGSLHRGLSSVSGFCGVRVRGVEPVRFALRGAQDTLARNCPLRSRASS